MRNSNTTLKQANKQKERKKAHCFFDQIAMNAEASVTCSQAFPAWNVSNSDWFIQ